MSTKPNNGRRPAAEMARLKALAEKLYVEDSYALTKIADEIGVNNNTLTNWKKDGDWDSLRDYIQNAPHRIEKMLLEEMEKVARGEESKIDADKLSKIKSTLTMVQQLRKEISPTIVSTMLKKLDSFYASRYPEKVIEAVDIHREFLLYIIQENG